MSPYKYNPQGNQKGQIFAERTRRRSRDANCKVQKPGLQSRSRSVAQQSSSPDREPHHIHASNCRSKKRHSTAEKRREMENVRRTHRYEFKKPDLESLRKLARRLEDPDHFRKRYGCLVDILMTKVDEGLLNTLVQFYDPIYHGFTFPDFQLFPTLEEYSHWVGLPVLNQVPFHSLELTPKIPDLAKALHLDITDIKNKFVPRTGLQCLSYNFLYQKATICLGRSKFDAFESILALLIYGIVLFPNVNDFVDMNAIQIFLTQNPVPTLLADTYVSIHERTNKGKGTIICCAPLLHMWITSHLPRPKFRPEYVPWSQKLMTLTPNDITWFNPACDPEAIIDRCGESNNVPLLGIRGGISYSPVLARRQFGYPMKMKPLYRILDRDFFLYKEDGANQKAQFVKAWHSIIRVDRNQLGRKSNTAHEAYVKWVIDRANKLKMPYPQRRLTTSTIPSMPLPLPPKTQEESQEREAVLILENATLKRKYDEAMLKMETMSGKIEQQEHELLEQKEQIAKKDAQIQAQSARLAQFISKKERMDFFAGAHPDFEE